CAERLDRPLDAFGKEDVAAVDRPSLSAPLKIRFQPQEPIGRGLPVVANLAAADDTRHVQVCRVQAHLWPGGHTPYTFRYGTAGHAVTDVPADIGACP